MEACDVESLIRGAIELLFAEDDLSIEVNERTITHRLAVHLEACLRKINNHLSVDCEYNRDGRDPKRLMSISREIARTARPEDLIADTQGRTVFPDIVVHKRGRRGPNFLVIEVKRATASAAELTRDHEKLYAYVDEFDYKHAYLVVLGHNRTSSIRRVQRNHSLASETGARVDELGATPTSVSSASPRQSGSRGSRRTNERASSPGDPRLETLDVTDTLPKVVVFRGRRLPVRYWCEVLTTTLEQLILNAPDEFGNIMAKLRRLVPLDSSTDNRGHGLRQLSNGAFVKTNMSAADIHRICLQALQVIGIGPDEWRVERVSRARGERRRAR